MIAEKSFTRITLALDIIRKLDDGPHAGYHELNIIKHQIHVYDLISLEPSEQMRLTCSDPKVPVDERNLCWKAVDVVKQQFGREENVHISIEKNIPVRGGLAGGSANAATVLSMLNRHWNLNLDTQKLRDIGQTIGMDVPYYFIGGTAFDTEATGVLEQISTDCRFHFVLAIPDFGISTRQAYNNIDYTRILQNRDKTLQMRNALASGDYDSVIPLMHNDFEESVFKHFPQLRQLKEELINAGCLNAVLSGSGSTIIGIAEDREYAEEIHNRISTSCIITSTL